MTNPRPRKTAPATPTFAELEENVRQRLVTNGQSGALAEFGKYTAAVHEQLARSVVAPQSAAETKQIEKLATKPKAAAKPKAKSK